MTEAMSNIMVKIMAEVLEILAIMTTEIKQGQSIPDDMFPVVDRCRQMSRKNYFKNLIGRKGIEDALSRLDSLMQEAVKIMKAARTEEEKR